MRNAWGSRQIAYLSGICSANNRTIIVQDITQEGSTIRVNEISGRTVAKNASVLMASQLITWGLTFLLMIFLTRYLGPEGLGKLQLAGSLWAIVAVIAALGTDTLVTKEIARSPGRLNELLGTTLALRALIFLVCAMGMAAYVRLADYSSQTESVIWIVGIASLIMHLSNTYDAGLKGLERMEYSSLAAVVSSALLSFLRIGLLLLGFGIVAITGVGIIASIASLSIMFYYLRKLYSFKLSVNWRLMRSILQDSLPYFLVSVGIILYSQVDTVIISLLTDEKTIGWYGAAARLFGTLLFIPNVFMIALFPALSRTYADSQASSRKFAQKSLTFMVLVSIPIGLGLMVVANQLVVLLFGTPFANSGPVLAIRGILLTFTFVNMLLGFLLISMDRQKTWAVVILAATVVTILLDLVLVPWTVKTFANGAIGGALSFAFTETGMILAGIALLPRGYFSWANGKAVAKLILAGLVMVGATWIWRDAIILIPIILGAVTYIGMVIILHALPKEDWNFIIGTIHSIFQRARRRFFKVVELDG